MTELNHIEKFLKDQGHIILDLNISINNMLRLEENRYKFEEDIKKHGFLIHHWYQLKFIAVIQLAKLFSWKENEKRSFEKLCSKLECGDYSPEFKQFLTNNALKPDQCATSKADLYPIFKETRITLSENECVIKKIIDARDQIYAHQDPDPKVEYITTDEIRKLVKIAVDLHNSFEIKLFNRSTMFSETDSWNVDYVLFYMTELRKKDKEEHQRILNELGTKKQN